MGNFKISVKVKLTLIVIAATVITFGLNTIIKNPLISILAAIIINATITFIASLRLKNNILKISNALKDLASGKGDLTIKLDVKTNDEMNEISQYFNEFISQLEQIIAKINLTSEKVVDSSVNLSKNLSDTLKNNHNSNHIDALRNKMQHILENVNNQTAYSQEAASSITEISHSITIVDDRAQKTKDLASETSELAKEGEKNIVKNIEEFKNIEISVQNIEEKALVLESSSKKIFQIVDMINKITEQTGLLSLNAAIEAARAGEAGRGFSIVADEVRKLASDSSEATSEIETLVKSIQSEIKELVILAKNGYDQVQSGRKITEQTNDKILDIIEKVQTTSKEVEEISTSIREQKQAVDEINQAMDEISNQSIEISNLSNDQLMSTESIEGTLKETTQYSGSLSEVSDALNNLVKNFKISENVEIKENKAVEWSGEYSVHVKDMDSEHQRLFDLINDLNEAMLQGQSSNVISGIIQGLIDYTEKHFNHEEVLMEKCSYPGLPEQKKAHRMFVAKIVEFKDELESGEMLLSVKIIQFLKEWLIKHIMVVDKKYSDHMNKSGIK